MSRRRGLVVLTVLNVALLANLGAVYYALVRWAASIVWWANALLVLAPFLAAFTTIVAVRERRFALAVANGACVIPYGVLFALCL